MDVKGLCDKLGECEAAERELRESVVKAIEAGHSTGDRVSDHLVLAGFRAGEIDEAADRLRALEMSLVERVGQYVVVMRYAHGVEGGADCGIVGAPEWNQAQFRLGVLGSAQLVLKDERNNCAFGLACEHWHEFSAHRGAPSGRFEGILDHAVDRWQATGLMVPTGQLSHTGFNKFEWPYSIFVGDEEVTNLLIGGKDRSRREMFSRLELLHGFFWSAMALPRDVRDTPALGEKLEVFQGSCFTTLEGLIRRIRDIQRQGAELTVKDGGALKLMNDLHDAIKGLPAAVDRAKQLKLDTHPLVIEATQLLATPVFPSVP